MSHTCYIIDDQQHVIDGLSELIAETPGLDLLGSDQDPVRALNRILFTAIAPDIIFLDIDMPVLNGLDFSAQLRGRCSIIFVTAHRQYAAEAFELGATDYLLKPINPARFAQAVQRVQQNAINRKIQPAPVRDFMFVRITGRDITKVLFENLLRVEGSGNYVLLHLIAGKNLLVRQQIGQFDESLPADLFARIHKSHIINLRHVAKIVGDRVMMENGDMVEVSRSYMEELKRRLNVT